MKDLRIAAQKRDAQACIRLLKDGLQRQSPRLEDLSFKYENGLLGDLEFCEEIDEYINF